VADAAGGVEVVDAHELAEIAITIETTTATARERNGFVIGWWEICGLDVITRPFAGDDGGMTIRRGWPMTGAIARHDRLWAAAGRARVVCLGTHQVVMNPE